MENPNSPPPNAEDAVKKEPLKGLNTDTETWEGMLNAFILWVAKDPWTFLGYVGAVLAPLFLISAILSWKLSKSIEKQEKTAKGRRRSPRKSAKADWIICFQKKCDDSINIPLILRENKTAFSDKRVIVRTTISNSILRKLNISSHFDVYYVSLNYQHE